MSVENRYRYKRWSGAKQKETKMVFRTILYEYMHNYNVLSSLEYTYSLLLIGNARTRTTACFPMIAVNGSIHVYTRKKEKAVTTKWVISSLQQSFFVRARTKKNHFLKKLFVCLLFALFSLVFFFSSSDFLSVITLLQSTL